jgi:16S rRNA (adenine1518-N6/adenine1519-N6)-dimethyltransferase
LALPFSPKKSLGQNFLTDPNTARKIVAAVRAPEGGAVVEIGPGTGALTEILHERFRNLTAIEIDGRAVAVLRERFPDLDVRQGDVLEIDWPALAEEKAESLYVVGNLPYYITSPILFGLLDARAVLHEAVLMMQLEVAQRLVAVPRTKDYGILAVQVQLLARPELLFRVSRNVFFPRPDVASAVVRLGFDDVPPSDDAVDPELLRTVIRTAFNQRRKTLRNSLSHWTRAHDLALPHGWDRKRAEELEPDEFVELTRYLQEHL